jgi:hypothetical protein
MTVPEKMMRKSSAVRKIRTAAGTASARIPAAGTPKRFTRARTRLTGGGQMPSRPVV